MKNGVYIALFCLLLPVFVCCTKPVQNPSDIKTPFTSYRQIRGVTREEVAAVESIRRRSNLFVYGMLPSTETFLDANGEIRGYSALVCEWLTELFGISFIPRHYSWVELLEGLETGTVDFSGDLTATQERRRTYYMTETMAQRSVKYFRIAGSLSFAEISLTRLPRYLLQENNTISDDIMFYAGERFEPVYIREYEEAYDILKSGRADALVTEGVQEAFFDVYGDIVVSDFFPLIYSPVSFTTQNPQLAPIISILQKALDDGGAAYLYELHDRGYREYLQSKFLRSLTEEERGYIRDNPVIPFAAEYDNYPISFFSVRTGEWQGICFDVLEEMKALTGLQFTVINNNKDGFLHLVRMLESGEAYVVSELIDTPDRRGRFIWPYNSFFSEWSVLISKINHPNININRVYSKKIGLTRGIAHTEFFFRWFPNHPNFVIYDSQFAAFDALQNDKVDMVMNSYSTLLYLTNYQELTGFKANIMFNNYFESTFGINKDQVILRSIMDKALSLIDTRTISEQWRHRVYDYRLKIEQARTPWFIGFVALSLCVASLVAFLFIRSRRTGRQLEELVDKRTYELALQTTTLTTLFDSIPDLIFTKNLNLNFLHCNKAFLEHFGREIDDLVGKSDTDGLGINADIADEFNEVDRKVICEGETIAVEEHIPRIDGVSPIYETIKMPLMLEGNVVGVMGISRDITKRKEMEEAALAASQSKSSFLANMSHEIRTPMNAILGVTEILIQYESLPPEIEEGLGKIYSSCDMLLGIINDILDFSKIEAGKLDIMPSRYKVASMINDSAHLNMMRIGSKPIEFELKVDENIPAKLYGDELRIKQILNNLLSNAFKYTDSGKVTLTVGYEPEADNMEVKLVLEVRDTGHGMTKEQLNKVFDEYSRFIKDKNITVEGTGLGLAITQRLVNLMDGEMNVESELDKGTFFTVKLPQGKVDSDIIGKDLAANLSQFRMSYITQKRRGQIVRDPMPYGSVLIVDDVETNLYVAVGLMKLYKLMIETAMSGQEAISKIKEGRHYDVIFMDHMMPEMDGMEVTKILRGMGYTSPIVALTANAVSGQADIFLHNGFNDFISKPIDIRQLNSTLIRFIRDKQTQEVIEAARRQAAESPSAADKESGHLLLDSFIRDAKKAVASLEKMGDDVAMQDADAMHKFVVIVHGIKSSLWNIGEKILSESAYRLETAGRENNTEIIKSSYFGFLDAMRALLARLETNRENRHSADSGGDIAELLDKLQIIRNMCADYNRKGIMDIIANLKDCSRETRVFLDTIVEQIMHSEFEEADNEIAAYLKKHPLRKINDN